MLPDALQLRVRKRNSDFQKPWFSKETNLSGEKDLVQGQRPRSTSSSPGAASVSAIGKGRASGESFPRGLL